MATGWVPAGFFHIRTRPAGLLSKPEPGLINFQTFAVFALVVFFLLLFSCYFSIQRLLWEKTQVKFHEKNRGITDNINLLRFFFPLVLLFLLLLLLPCFVLFCFFVFLFFGFFFCFLFFVFSPETPILAELPTWNKTGNTKIKKSFVLWFGF